MNSMSMEFVCLMYVFVETDGDGECVMERLSSMKHLQQYHQYATSLSYDIQMLSIVYGSKKDQKMSRESLLQKAQANSVHYVIYTIIYGELE